MDKLAAPAGNTAMAPMQSSEPMTIRGPSRNLSADEIKSIVDASRPQKAPVMEPNSLDKLNAEYPWTKSVSLNIKDSTSKGDVTGTGRKMEFYSANENDNPNPGKPTIEVFDKSMKSSDLMGEVLSHHLPKIDPAVADFRRQILSSMTPQQRAGINGDYQSELKAGLVDKGDTFDQWLNKQGGDSFFRGFPTGQWAPSEYTPDQKVIYRKLDSYLASKYSTTKAGK